MPNRSAVAVSCTNLAKRYGNGAPVLKDISLKIDTGETIALIGSNGAGKSTLLKCLIGLHDISSGKLDILGEQFERAPTGAQRKAIRRQIGFVFQQHGLVKRLSAHSNVVQGFFGLAGGWRAISQVTASQDMRLAAMEALDAVNLTEKAQARADQLSGGQSQRVAIARALVRKPKLFIADEPAASLDPSSGRDVMERFSRLAKDFGITLIFTSHDMEHALSYADRLIALKDGAVFIDAPTDDLKSKDLSGVFDG